jgi:spore germination protein
MDIYVVQTGDTIDRVANRFGVSVDTLIRDNALTDPYQLVPGEVIIIPYPSKTYTVQEGDTLETIASTNHISISELLRNNPFIADTNYIYPGEVLTISYNRIGRISTHGYTNTFINRQTLRKTLPCLTYLSIFNYRTVENGELIGSTEDGDIIQLAKDYGVIPLMHLSTISVQGENNIELTYEILINDEVQNRLMENVLRTVKDNGYYGVNISAQYITETNQNFFYNYTKKLSERLQQEGLLSVITINPKIDTFNNEVVTYENIDYSSISSLVDSVLLLQYKWSINTSPPSPVISIYNLGIFLDYAITQIEPDKITTGIPTLGYLWELPFDVGYSIINSLTIESAINLAREVGATIEFDEISQTPYFTFRDLRNIQYIVWFVNAITVNSLVELLLQDGITGTGVWNIMIYFPHLWLVLNSQYEIIKLLPEL